MEPRIRINGDGNAVGDGNEININKNAVTTGTTVDDLVVLLGQLRETLDTIELDPKTRRLLQADLEVVEGEVAGEKPSGDIIEAKLKSIEAVAKSVVGIGTATATFMPLIYRAVELVQGLFR
jgi:hypothetical protein